jgi:hypothetical protein
MGVPSLSQAADFLLAFQVFQGSFEGRIAHTGTNPLQLCDAEAIGEAFYGLLHHLSLGAFGRRDCSDALFEFPVCGY